MKTVSIIQKITFLFLLFPLLTFSQDGNSNYEHQSIFGSFAEKFNGKWGLKSQKTGEKWLVEPNYDTLLLVNSFDYPLASEDGYANIELVNQLYLFFNSPLKDEDFKEFNPLFLKIENPSFDVYKLNGEKCFPDSFQFFENRGKFYDYNDQVEFQIQFIQLRKDSKSYAVNQDFELREENLTDFEYFEEGSYFIAKQTGGDFALKDYTLKTEISAFKMEALIHPEKWDSISRFHGITWQESSYQIPYVKVYNSDGTYWVYSVNKKRNVTPVLTKTTNISVLESNSEFLFFEYQDGDKKGFYHSNMTEGTPCIFEWYNLNEIDEIKFEAKELGQEKKGLYTTEPYFDLITYFDELIYNSTETYYTFPEFARLNSKYRIVNQKDKNNAPLYDNLFPSESLKGFYNFTINGKFGATNGDVVIPAIFDNPIVFDFSFYDACFKRGEAREIYISQGILEQDKLVYYASSGDKFYQKQGDFRVYEFAKNSFGLVEYVSYRPGHFIESTDERYTFIDSNHVDHIYIAKRGKKFGLIELHGFPLTDFECSKITRLSDTLLSDPNRKNGLFYLLEKGKEKGIYSARVGEMIVPFDVQEIEPVLLNFELYFETSKQTKKQKLFGLTSFTGEKIYPTVYKEYISDNKHFLINNKHIIYQENQLVVSSKIEGELVLDTFFTFDDKPFKYNCFTDKLAFYDLETNRIIYAIDYLQFCRMKGFNIEKSGDKYLLTEKTLSDEKQEYLLDDFEIQYMDGRYVLIGTKEKSTFMYDMEGFNFEEFLSKTLVSFNIRKKK